MTAIETDVVICGSGSAGICAAVWLAQAGISFRMLERRPGPLKLGQADGVQCRTVEIFESFGVAEELLRAACHITELTFWSIDAKTGRLTRTHRAADTPIGLSHQPHVILNQAQVNQILLDKMAAFAPNQQIDYDYNVTAVEANAPDKDDEYPVQVHATHSGEEKTFKAKYVLACDGAHSSSRRSLGIQMLGDTSDAVWGVMDIFPRTNFPDIRRKATIHGDIGALLIIPREGGQLVRFYLQMPSGTNPKQVTLELLHDRARTILKGYELDAAETTWWSAYTIGQRLASQFTAADNRIILAGDACHTHSPKAGQGMNVSLQDGYNIGWKLAQILRGRMKPGILSTYVQERQMTAEDLINFDRRLTRLYLDHDTDASLRFQDHFLESAKYMAGVASKYNDTVFTNASESDQSLAKNIVVGMRFPSAKVIRYCDARVLELASALRSDNRWRILVFAGDLQLNENSQRLERLSSFLASHSIALASHDAGSDQIGIVEPLLVFANNRTKTELHQIPGIFRPEVGKYRIQNLQNIYVDDDNYSGFHGHAYEQYAIDPKHGAVIVVRPDQHISLVTSIDQPDRLQKFFSGFLI